MIKEFFKDLVGIVDVAPTAIETMLEEQKPVVHEPTIEKKKAELAAMKAEIARLTPPAPPEIIENIAPEDPLHVAAALVKPTVSCNAWNVGSELRKLYAYRHALSPMERAACDTVSDRIFELECKIRDAKFQRLDMSWIMKQRTKEGWPAFAIFQHNKPDCWMEHRETREDFRMSFNRDETHFPNIYKRNEYEDVNKRLEKVIAERFAAGDDPRGMKAARISCGFTGVLPERIRQRIEECSPRQRESFDGKKYPEFVPGHAMFDISIIMEAPAWKVDTRVIPVNMDPLVVGQFGKEFWLLDVFDVTPLERVAAAEFAEWKK